MWPNTPQICQANPRDRQGCGRADAGCVRRPDGSDWAADGLGTLDPEVMAEDMGGPTGYRTKRPAARGYTMKAVRITGTENYSEEAPELLKRYESISFADQHRSVIHLIPTVPGRVLDIGAGTGRDAAGFAGLGHSVLAVEPTEELRRGAMLLHPSSYFRQLVVGKIGESVQTQ
jgi:hypothetical protein